MKANYSATGAEHSPAQLRAKPGKFELADGGTILLDEIGEMPLHLQPKLLRALQEREFERLGESRPVHVDIRVIATTNVSLATMVERGDFRGDLYYRLNVIPLSLPPLRERREDIPILANHFAEKFAAQSGTRPPRLHPDFLDRLQSHAWPGNVRELANFMRRVLTLSGTLEIDAHCFEMEFQGAAESTLPYSKRFLQSGSRHSHPPDGTAASRKHPRSHRRQPDARRRNARHQPAHSAQQDSRIRPSSKEVCINGHDSPLLQILQGYLKVVTDRQQLIATNMANVDTPGYQTKDIDFQSAMRQVMDGDTAGSLQEASLRRGKDLPERPDGNNVNIDRESMTMSETQLQYQMGVQLIKVQFHDLLTAIKEGSNRPWACST